jgi:uncharacterized oligopeptide transporter (OPT) family protein
MAVAASLGLPLAPFGVEGASLVATEGVGVAFLFALPVLFALAGLVGILRRWLWAIPLASAILIFVSSWGAGYLGVFYWPSSGAMLVAAVRAIIGADDNSSLA